MLSIHKKEIPKLLISIVALIAGILLFLYIYNYAPSNQHYLEKNKPQINRSIKNAADFLTSQCKADGTFVYRYDARKEFKVDENDYNLVRHAGALYALATYARHNKSSEIVDALTRCGNFLKTQIYDLRKEKDTSAILSLVDLKDRGKLTKVKLGGVGLGLVALMSIEKIIKGFTDLKTLRKIANFIVYMQKPDGDFYSIYQTAENVKDETWTSLYYPGEAMLGLVMLYEIDKNPLWIRTAGKGMLYLASQREGKINVLPDHWALLATERMLVHYGEISSFILKKDLIHHGAQVSSSILNARPGFRYNSPYFGAITSDARTTPTATRLEGVLAAYNFLPENFKGLRKKIEKHAHRGINFLINSQIDKGENKGAITRKFLLRDNSGKIVINENSEKNDSEIRIDYVQHALSAMIQYRDIFLAE